MVVKMPRFVQNPKKVDNYLQNLNQAVEDLFAEMYVDEISASEIRKTINHNVKITIDYWEKWSRDNLHKQSSYQKRKLR